jgi:hypothetical protein
MREEPNSEYYSPIRLEDEVNNLFASLKSIIVSTKFLSMMYLMV